MKRMEYPLDYNPILEYWEAIESGKEMVGDKIRRWYRYLASLVRQPGEYFYSAKRANHVIEFAENYCRLSKAGRCGWSSGRRPTLRPSSDSSTSRATGCAGRPCSS